MQAVLNGLIHQGVVWKFNGSSAVILTHDLLGKDGRQQILGAHALNGHGDLSTSAKSLYCKGARCVPPPPTGEDRGGEHRLN